MKLLFLLLVFVVVATVSNTSHAGFLRNSPAPLAYQSGAMGGTALLAGACASIVVIVPGATVNMAVIATPVVNPGIGASWYGYVSSADNVTVRVCAMIGMTPTSTTYNIRVIH